MTQPTTSAGDFYFELTANGEQTTFNEVDGISTEVKSGHLIKPGENPFKYKLPTPPKTGKLHLKHGNCPNNSKLVQWCSGKTEEGSEIPKSNRIALHLKDRSGNSLIEWTFYNAKPAGAQQLASEPKSNNTEIKDLELNYSFYTFTTK